MEKIYRVLASNGIDEYSVQFIHQNGHLTVHCSCAAGSIGKLCKHKIGLFFGTTDTLPIEQSAQSQKEIALLIDSSQVARMMKALKETEDAVAVAEKAFKLAKKEIEKSIRPMTE